jgi:hypothetical protein
MQPDGSDLKRRPLDGRIETRLARESAKTTKETLDVGEAIHGDLAQ